jgi:hypothetical protein
MLLALAAATVASATSRASTARAAAICHWSSEDYIIDPSTHQVCGYHNSCTGQQSGCHGSGHTYETHWVTCPVGCCAVLGCGL